GPRPLPHHGCLPEREREADQCRLGPMGDAPGNDTLGSCRGCLHAAPGGPGEQGGGTTMKTMQVGIAGCGIIGRKRAGSLPPGSLKAVADISRERAESLAKDYPGAVVYTDWKEMLKQRDLDIIIVSTTNDGLAPITLAAVQAGKHVLVEKP